MEKLRSDCPSLNFFTTDQLVTLSRDLAKFVHKKSKSLDTQSIMMLKCIAPLMENKDLLKFVLSHFPGASAQGKKIILKSEIGTKMSIFIGFILFYCLPIYKT